MGVETLERKSVPGSPLEATLCPNCSRMYPSTRLEDYQNDDHEDKTRVVEDLEMVPSKCQRCGSPMDFEDGGAFSDLNAEEAAHHRPPRRARTRQVTRKPAAGEKVPAAGPGPDEPDGDPDDNPPAKAA